MKPKKTKVITFRIDEDTKTKIEAMAEEKFWSVSQVVERICIEYFQRKETDQNDSQRSNQ